MKTYQQTIQIAATKIYHDLMNGGTGRPTPDTLATISSVYDMNSKQVIRDILTAADQIFADNA